MFEKMIDNMLHDIMFRLFVEDYYKKRNDLEQTNDIEGFVEYLKIMNGVFGNYVLSQIENSFLQFKTCKEGGE